MTDSSGSSPSGRRRLMLGLASGCALVLVAALLVGTRLFGFWDPEPGPEAQPSPSPTAAPSPFMGTPAEHFAEGAAGIELPPAEPVGDFTADQVQAALEQVREALIAARLDESMLVDHDPSNFLATLAPDLRPTLEAEFSTANFASFATQVDEDAELLPMSPRVAGKITYEAVIAELDHEVIELVTRHVWVYPFGDDQTSTDLVVVRDELIWWFQLGEPWLESSEGLWLTSETARRWGADCEVAAAGRLHPNDEPAASLNDQAERIFDPEGPLDSAGSC